MEVFCTCQEAVIRHVARRLNKFEEQHLKVLPGSASFSQRLSNFPGIMSDKAFSKIFLAEHINILPGSLDNKQKRSKFPFHILPGRLKFCKFICRTHSDFAKKVQNTSSSNRNRCSRTHKNVCAEHIRVSQERNTVRTHVQHVLLIVCFRNAKEWKVVFQWQRRINLDCESDGSPLPL